MTALVADKVTYWLADHPGSTVEEIARGIHHRHSAIREVLQSPLFVFGARGSQTVWSLRSAARAGQGRAERAQPESDCDYLLRVLRDGEWHTIGEILRRSIADRGHGLTIHSRAAQLRKRGFVVENETNTRKARGENSRYRLLGEGEAQAVEADTDPGSPPVRRSTVPHSLLAASPSPSGQPLTEPGSLLPDLGVAPSVSGTDDQSRTGATDRGKGSTRPGSVSGLGDAVSGGTPELGAALQPDGQLTLTGTPFRKAAA